MNRIEAQAEALRAINAAKHKTLGRTHRVQIDVFGPQGGYRETKVFYTTGAPNIAAVAIKAGSKSISASLETAQVTAI